MSDEGGALRNQAGTAELAGRASDISPAGSSGLLGAIGGAVGTVATGITDAASSAAGAVAGVTSAAAGAVADATSSAAGAVADVGAAIDALTPEWVDTAAQFVAAPLVVPTAIVVKGATAALAATGAEPLEKLDQAVGEVYREGPIADMRDAFASQVATGAALGAMAAGVPELGALAGSALGALGVGAPELPAEPPAPTDAAGDAATGASSSSSARPESFLEWLGRVVVGIFGGTT